MSKFFFQKPPQRHTNELLYFFSLFVCLSFSLYPSLSLSLLRVRVPEEDLEEMEDDKDRPRTMFACTTGKDMWIWVGLMRWISLQPAIAPAPSVCVEVVLHKKRCGRQTHTER